MQIVLELQCIPSSSSSVDETLPDDITLTSHPAWDPRPYSTHWNSTSHVVINPPARSG